MERRQPQVPHATEHEGIGLHTLGPEQPPPPAQSKQNSVAGAHGRSPQRNGCPSRSVTDGIASQPASSGWLADASWDARPVLAPQPIAKASMAREKEVRTPPNLAHVDRSDQAPG